MQRRQSHPHGQLTGLIVLISMMLSVGMMFYLPGVPQQPAHAAAVATTGTASLPITRTPRAERGPASNSGELPTPTMDWSTIPTAIPADQLVAEALAATAAAIPPTPVIVYQPAPPPDNSALIAVQQALVDAQAYAQEQADAMKAQADAAFESQRQQDARHAADLVAAQQTAVPAVKPSDFVAPDPNAKCAFVGCL